MAQGVDPRNRVPASAPLPQRRELQVVGPGDPALVDRLHQLPEAGVGKLDIHWRPLRDILVEPALEDAIEPTSVRNLFVVPSSIDLAGAEIEAAFERMVPWLARQSF